MPGGAYSTVTLLDLDPAGLGFYHLSGPYVRSVDIENPVIAPPAELAPNFTYTRQSDDFEWVMAYYHLDAVERFIQGLGFVSINNRTIDVDAHGDDGEDNSHYSPDGFGTGYMSLGDGGVDDAEDAEVVVHEFGHSAQDNQCVDCFFGPEAGAMGEGFGDFLAAAYFLNVSAGYQNECLFDWDSTASSIDSPPCLHRLDTTKRYPRAILRSDREIQIVGETGGDLSASPSSFRRPPKVIVASHAPDERDPTRSIRQLRAVAGHLVLVVARAIDPETVRALLKAGATGCLLRNALASELIPAVKAVASGRRFLSAALQQVIVEDCLRPPEKGDDRLGLADLTGRQREILQLIGEGRTRNEIAHLLAIRPATVDSHRQAVMAKLGLHNVAQLVRFAMRHGLVE